MRSDRLYLADIVEAMEAIEGFLIDLDKAAFLASDLHQSGVLQKLTIIGEAASRISKELRDEHPEVEWRDIVGFRNFIVHEYFSVDWKLVWIAATEEAPALRDQVQKILSAEYGDGDSR